MHQIPGLRISIGIEDADDLIKGRIQGEEETVTIEDAMYAITLGAAYTLHMDNEVGSLETGKRADLAILEEDPFLVNPDELKNVKVWGTMQQGRIFDAKLF